VGARSQGLCCADIEFVALPIGEHQLHVVLPSKRPRRRLDRSTATAIVRTGMLVRPRNAPGVGRRRRWRTPGRSSLGAQQLSAIAAPQRPVASARRGARASKSRTTTALSLPSCADARNRAIEPVQKNPAETWPRLQHPIRSLAGPYLHSEPPLLLARRQSAARTTLGS